MVHRPSDSRLLGNLLTSEKEYTKSLGNFLDVSQTSIASFTAYASASAPPASQAVIAVAAAFAKADDALKKYAGAVDEWREQLRILKEMEDSVGNIMRDREILVNRLIKLSKSKSSNRDSMVSLTSSTAVSVSSPSKLNLAQLELQACEAHLADKERELHMMRNSAIGLALKDRCQALAECGWTMNEVAKDGVAALDGMGMSATPNGFGPHSPYPTPPGQFYKPLPDHLHGHHPRLSSELCSSLTPSQSASQIGAPIGVGSQAANLSDLSARAREKKPAPSPGYQAQNFPLMDIPAAYAIGDQHFPDDSAEVEEEADGDVELTRPKSRPGQNSNSNTNLNALTPTREEEMGGSSSEEPLDESKLIVHENQPFVKRKLASTVPISASAPLRRRSLDVHAIPRTRPGSAPTPSPDNNNNRVSSTFPRLSNVASSDIGPRLGGGSTSGSASGRGRTRDRRRSSNVFGTLAGLFRMPMKSNASVASSVHSSPCMQGATLFGSSKTVPGVSGDERVSKWVTRTDRNLSMNIGRGGGVVGDSSDDEDDPRFAGVLSDTGIDYTRSNTRFNSTSNSNLKTRTKKKSLTRPSTIGGSTTSLTLVSGLRAPVENIALTPSPIDREPSMRSTATGGKKLRKSNTKRRKGSSVGGDETPVPVPGVANMSTNSTGTVTGKSKGKKKQQLGIENIARPDTGAGAEDDERKPRSLTKTQPQPQHGILSTGTGTSTAVNPHPVRFSSLLLPPSALPPKTPSTFIRTLSGSGSGPGAKRAVSLDRSSASNGNGVRGRLLSTGGGSGMGSPFAIGNGNGNGGPMRTSTPRNFTIDVTHRSDDLASAGFLSPQQQQLQQQGKKGSGVPSRAHSMDVSRTRDHQHQNNNQNSLMSIVEGVSKQNREGWNSSLTGGRGLYEVTAPNMKSALGLDPFALPAAPSSAGLTELNSRKEIEPSMMMRPNGRRLNSASAPYLPLPSASASALSPVMGLGVTMTALSPPPPLPAKPSKPPMPLRSAMRHTQQGQTPSPASSAGQSQSQYAQQQQRTMASSPPLPPLPKGAKTMSLTLPPGAVGVKAVGDEGDDEDEVGDDSDSEYDTGDEVFEDAEEDLDDDLDAPPAPRKSIEHQHQHQQEQQTKPMPNGILHHNHNRDVSLTSSVASNSVSASNSNSTATATATGPPNGIVGTVIGQGPPPPVPPRRKVRVSLHPTFSATPPALDEEDRKNLWIRNPLGEDDDEDDDELGVGGKGKAQPTPTKAGWRTRASQARSSWEDSSDEDEEYARARRMLMKSTLG